ncbi:MAG: twin-arginine translocase subunit TatC, partial [Nocardioidaceae bacterium]
MSLIQHLRELRRRLVVSVIVIVIGFIVGFVYYDEISRILTNPYTSTVQRLAREQGVRSVPVVSGVATPFLLQMKVSLVSAIVLASPVWLYQIWAFIMPGLHRTERKWTILFAAIAGPLFLAGVALGYYVLPKGLAVLIGFTPDQVTNLVDL